jgi:hypothetical protein
LARWHRAPGHFAAGVHAATGGYGATPRLHLIRFHGVLAPSAKLRAEVVPREPDAPAQEGRAAECDARCAHHRPVPLSWARLLERVFEIDMEHCPRCGGEQKIIAAILEQPVIE